jgi:hypothetical protein
VVVNHLKQGSEIQTDTIIGGNMRYEILNKFDLTTEVQGLLEEQVRKTSTEVLKNVTWLLEDCRWRNENATQQIEEFKNRLIEISWDGLQSPSPERYGEY